MVVGLMKLHTDYDAFHNQLNQIAPVYPESRLFSMIRRYGEATINLFFCRFLDYPRGGLVHVFGAFLQTQN